MDIDGGAGCSANKGSKRKLEDGEWFKSLRGLSDVEFRREFKISKSTFNFICAEMRNCWSNEQLHFPVEERIAIIIWKLANGKTGVEIGEKFGLSSHRALVIFNDGCCKIVENLKSKYLSFPGKQTDDRYKIKKGFEEISLIPDVVGAIYTTHLQIRENREGFRNELMEKLIGRKNMYTLAVQGVVDSKCIFIDVFFSAGGNTDEEILMESDIYKDTSSLVQGERLVGDRSLPLKDWLLVPFPVQTQTRQQTREQRLFNKKISDIHDIAREAFGRLIGRWSYLGKKIETSSELIQDIVCACCILHNICEEKEDSAEEFHIFVGDYHHSLQ